MSQKEENEKVNNTGGLAKCSGCSKILNYGYDEDDMLHCQNPKCHRIWDGFAQCPCWSEDFSSSESNSDQEESE